MDIAVGTRPVTLRQTYSFYVSGRDPGRIRACAQQADAVVVAGPNGPASVRKLRDEGWDGVALFDRASYAANAGNVDPDRWFEEQVAAGADRLLTPGRWMEVQPGHASFEAQIAEEMTLAERHGATCVLAISYQWLTKSAEHDDMRQTLEALESPVALVLGDRTDPLGHPGAVDALVALTRRIEGLSILRCDHGAIGALAFNAAHGSMGLTTTHRHVVPPTVQARAIPNDRSARVFVKDLMDWFAASTIAGWATTRVAPTCNYECCGGARIDRFLDDRLKNIADLHNRTVLSKLAELILEVPDVGDRRRAFGRMCFDAVERYGVMGGLTTEIKPKAQLVQWAQYS